MMTPDFRRRAFAIDNRWGAGSMAAIELGPEDRDVDIVFLHGNGLNARTYQGLIAPAAKRLRILIPDLRGHGLSNLPANPRGRWTYLDYRDDVIDLLRQLGGSPVVLAGHSMGAMAALLVADAAPHLLRRFVLFDPVILPPLSAVIAQAPFAHLLMRRTLPLAVNAAKRRSVFADKAAVFSSYRGRGAFKTWSDATLHDYIEDGFQALPSGEVALACSPAWEASNFAAHGYDLRGVLRKRRVPAQIFCAEHGSLCDLTPESRLAEIEIIPQTSHFLTMERPEILQDKLMQAAAL